ncbi:glycosyltransferase involved in cell wall biosynthesis [Paraburkholderia youngii]|uniref:glycosyltransferase family 4 protein n=1 Tax=Paraburkholderia youngii TaxID=2782701 RepID=UPI003D259143
MNWAALERRVRTYIYPEWMEAWHIRRARRGLSQHRASPKSDQRRLFVDVSVIRSHDAGTGIQRVVRAVATQLLESPPPGWTVQAVSATRKLPYHAVAWPSADTAGNDTPIEFREGDFFFGLDFALDTVRIHRGQLADLKRRGGTLWFVMYDLLPLQRPDWFSDQIVIRFRKWLTVIASLADGFYCISPPVEQELRKELAQRFQIADDYRTYTLPMGWDLATRRPSTGIPDGFDTLLKQLAKHPTALMVGTLEPRKGHGDVLAAFNYLWQQGRDYNIVFVGRPGWKTEDLQTSLRRHPLNGKRLFWLDNASDEALSRLYAVCDGVLMASHAEGFGLPLLEALGHGKPVLARDLPIFRLHAGNGIDYFKSDLPRDLLGQCIANWLDATDDTLTIRQPVVVSSWSDTIHAIHSSLIDELA